MKKQSNLSRLLDYAGTYRILTYLSWVLAAAGALLALVPFGYIWRILKEVIEVAPLAYMRGRTLDDAFIILDEAQNTTPEQMKMFLTRMGVGSKVVVTGDVTQIDLPDKVRSGLMDALHILRDVEGIAQVRLTEKDVVRHRLVQQIVKAYEKAAEEKAPGSHNHKQTMEVD